MAFSNKELMNTFGACMRNEDDPMDFAKCRNKISSKYGAEAASKIESMSKRFDTDYLPLSSQFGKLNDVAMQRDFRTCYNRKVPAAERGETVDYAAHKKEVDECLKQCESTSYHDCPWLEEFVRTGPSLDMFANDGDEGKPPTLASEYTRCRRMGEGNANISSCKASVAEKFCDSNEECQSEARTKMGKVEKAVVALAEQEFRVQDAYASGGGEGAGAGVGAVAFAPGSSAAQQHGGGGGGGGTIAPSSQSMVVKTGRHGSGWGAGEGKHYMYNPIQPSGYATTRHFASAPDGSNDLEVQRAREGF